MHECVPTLGVCLLQFVNSNQALATLPGAGVGQNLITLAPCAINQPHVHPRGTEISHITKGTHSRWHNAPIVWCMRCMQSALSPELYIESGMYLLSLLFCNPKS